MQDKKYKVISQRRSIFLQTLKSNYLHNNVNSYTLYGMILKLYFFFPLQVLIVDLCANKFVVQVCMSVCVVCVCCECLYPYKRG